ncbi:MAG: hypothetical protein IT243_00755 [Bacteroidia bacterium]|nr:hypothetical protein [Bacteroidia bacterium]
MKNKKEFILLTMFIASSFLSKAQNDKVIITKIYDDPKKNSWNVGMALGLDIQNKTSGGIYYFAHGRYTLGKLMTFNLNAAMDLAKLTDGKGLIKYGEVYNKLNPYMHIEGRASFHLSDKIKKVNCKANLGSDGEYNYSTNYTIDTREIIGLTASINIHNHIGGQMNDSSSDKRAYNVKVGNNNVYQPNSFVNQKNMILGVGIFVGNYSHSKYSFSAAPVTTKSAKIKKSFITAIEFLLALNMNMGSKAYWEENNQVKEGEITDVEKRRMGFRIITDYGKNKIGWFQHMEIGLRPGLYSPNKESKYLNQGYLSWGFGFGF